MSPTEINPVSFTGAMQPTWKKPLAKNGSVVTDYQFDKNTHTDSPFLQEALSQMEKSEEEIILVTDGGYDGQDNVAVAKEKNVRLIITALIGKGSGCFG